MTLYQRMVEAIAESMARRGGSSTIHDVNPKCPPISRQDSYRNNSYPPLFFSPGLFACSRSPITFGQVLGRVQTLFAEADCRVRNPRERLAAAILWFMEEGNTESLCAMRGSKPVFAKCFADAVVLVFANFYISYPYSESDAYGLWRSMLQKMEKDNLDLRGVGKHAKFVRSVFLSHIPCGKAPWYNEQRFSNATYALIRQRMMEYCANTPPEGYATAEAMARKTKASPQFARCQLDAIAESLEKNEQRSASGQAPARVVRRAQYSTSLETVYYSQAVCERFEKMIAATPRSVQPYVDANLELQLPKTADSDSYVTLQELAQCIAKMWQKKTGQKQAPDVPTLKNLLEGGYVKEAEGVGCVSVLHHKTMHINNHGIPFQIAKAVFRLYSEFCWPGMETWKTKEQICAGNHQGSSKRPNVCFEDSLSPQSFEAALKILEDRNDPLLETGKRQTITNAGITPVYSPELIEKIIEAARTVLAPVDSGRGIIIENLFFIAMFALGYDLSRLRGLIIDNPLYQELHSNEGHKQPRRLRPDLGSESRILLFLGDVKSQLYTATWRSFEERCVAYAKTSNAGEKHVVLFFLGAPHLPSGFAVREEEGIHVWHVSMLPFLSREVALPLWDVLENLVPQHPPLPFADVAYRCLAFLEQTFIGVPREAMTQLHQSVSRLRGMSRSYRDRLFRGEKVDRRELEMFERTLRATFSSFM